MNIHLMLQVSSPLAHRFSIKWMVADRDDRLTLVSFLAAASRTHGSYLVVSSCTGSKS